MSAGKTNNNMDIMPVSNIPILERKASVYAEVVKDLNNSREHGIQFKVSFSHFIAFYKLYLGFCIFFIIVTSLNQFIQISKHYHNTTHVFLLLYSL